MMILVLSAGCGKDDGICTGSTGKVILENRTVSDFHYVEVWDNINLFLTQDTITTGLQIEAGENLIDGITTETERGRLIIRNRNTCNWLRSFEVPVNVYLKYRSLDTLITHAAGNITGMNTWTGNTIWITVEEGGGKIDLDLNVAKSFITLKYGTFALDFSGFSQVTFISDLGYGPLHAENLYSKFTYIYTGSPNDIFVTAHVQITAEIRNAGNVYYHGDPQSVSTQLIGSGRLYKF
jgi:hypothetical protein